MIVFLCRREVWYGGFGITDSLWFDGDLQLGSLFINFCNVYFNNKEKKEAMILNL